MFSLLLRGWSPPRNTVPRDKHTHHPKRHLDRFSRFHMGPKCYVVQCTVVWGKYPQNCPFRLRFRHPAGGGPIIGNVHKNLIKHVIPEIYWRRDRHRYTDMLKTILAHPLKGFTTYKAMTDECIRCCTMLQVTTGAIANLSTRIYQLWCISRWTTIRLSGSILL